MLVGPVHQEEVWTRSSQRELARSNIHTSTTALRQNRTFTGRQFLCQLGHRRNDVCPRSPLRFRCASLNGRQPLCNGREETLYFFPQVRDRLAIAREMPQQASLEQSIKQRIEGGPGDNRLSATK